MIKAINKALRNKKGFTLVELIVVIAVLGILASIAVPRFSGVKESAKLAVDEQTVELMKKGIELYYAEHDVYPSSTKEAKDAIHKVLDEIPAPQTNNKYWYKSDGHIKLDSSQPQGYDEITPD